MDINAFEYSGQQALMVNEQIDWSSIGLSDGNNYYSYNEVNEGGGKNNERKNKRKKHRGQEVHAQ